MKRLFSILRRRPNYVDLWAPKIAGATMYRLKWAASFGGAPAMIIECSNAGYRDQNIDPAIVVAEAVNNGVRMVFDPASFEIPDLESFWIQLVPVIAGAETDPGAMTLVLPPGVRHGYAVGIVGTPIGTQQIDLPRLRDIRFVTSAPIEVGIEDEGELWTIPATTTGVPYGTNGQVSSLYVKGGAFSMTGVLVR